MDTTRPVLDSSGYSHRVSESDIYDSHDYNEDVDFDEGFAKMKKRHAGMSEDKPFINGFGERDASIPYRGQPYFVSEFGGFKWVPNMAIQLDEAEKGGDRKISWGYGSAPRSLDEFYRRFALTCELLLDDPNMFGYCYTQLTDVHPEENGIYLFDRTSKFDNALLKRIQERPAAIED